MEQILPGGQRDTDEEEKRYRRKDLTELSSTPLPSVSYSRNMTRRKQEKKNAVMSQITPGDYLLSGAVTLVGRAPAGLQKWSMLLLQRCMGDQLGD